MFGQIAYGRCIIQILAWNHYGTKAAGYVCDFSNFMSSLASGYEDLFGKHFHVDIKKVKLTRDVSKARQITIPYYPTNEYSYPSFGEFENILFNNDFKLDYYYRDTTDDSYKVTEIRLVFIDNTTFEALQDSFDRNWLAPRKAISKKIRQQVYDKYSGHCAYCGKELNS